MKALFLILLTFSFLASSGQDLQGKYKDYFGHSLELNNDSTFKFEWRFDLIYNWAIGKWSIKGEVLTFNFITVYDTLKRASKPDSLVLSSGTTSNSIDESQFAESQLILGGQFKDRFPNKLKRKGKKLYLINFKGNISRSKQRGIWPQKRWVFGYKKWPIYYRKVE